MSQKTELLSILEKYYGFATKKFSLDDPIEGIIFEYELSREREKKKQATILQGRINQLCESMDQLLKPK